MWKFWSLTFYFYLSDWEGLSFFQTILLKRVELTPSAAGRMVTSEGRDWGGHGGMQGELGALGRTGLVQILACLRLSCIVHEASTHSLPKTLKSLDLCAHLLSPKHSAACSSIKRGWNSKLLEEQVPSPSKNFFFSPLALALSFWHWVP